MPQKPRKLPPRPIPVAAFSAPPVLPGEVSVADLRHAAFALPPPASLFSGLRWAHGMAPDNIVFFKRTDTSAFRPEGVTNNYHHRFELVVVMEKGGPVRIGDTTYRLQPGEAALIFPNQFHHYMDVEQGRMEWLFITFELQNPQEIAALRDSPRILGTPHLHLLRLSVAEYAQPAAGEPDPVEISCHLSHLLRALLAAPEIPPDRRNLSTGRARDPKSGENARDVILEKINRYVRSHLKKAPAIGDLARDLNYSVSHLRAVFRDELGVSLGKYIRESRLAAAASDLLTTDKKVSEIAEETGFRSLYALSRAFKQAYGMAPRAYKKSFR